MNIGLIFKRIFDVIVSFIGLIIFLPLMVVIAIIVKLTSPGPIFFGSERVGVGGKVFKMIKFRSMVVNADKIGSLVTAGNDPRITSIGKYLRDFKWDELPSLWNVLKGDMSFVGPRPENPKSVASYTENQRRILSVKPGITSLATIKYRYEEEILAEADDLEKAYFRIMQDKLKIDLEYLENRSFTKDIRIIFQTLAEIVK
jgi:lipopolysaccharide/colanic/teichoic acid biosynthesis glycosyltransferase